MTVSIFKNKKQADSQKLLGGYYTPKKLSQYLIDWALESGAETIIEPSCGDGNFIESIFDYLEKSENKKKFKSCKIVAVEVNQDEIHKAKLRIAKRITKNFDVNWYCDDFFKLFNKLEKNKADVICGNPPFIRFQYFDNAIRDEAFNHLRRFGYSPNKLANVWSAFIQLSIELLKPGGKLAMVCPAELLQVNYASELRDRISKSFKNITIIGFKKLVFPDIQQEVLLLLADGKIDSPSIDTFFHTVEYEDGTDLLKNGHFKEKCIHRPSKYNQSKMKWTSLFLSDKSYDAINSIQNLNGLNALGDLVSIDVGIVTGRNSFFILNDENRNKLCADEYLIPIIGKTNVLKSIAFLPKDYDEYKKNGYCYLLNLNGITQDNFPKNISEYLQLGEKENVHTGYKCRIRKRWFDVPSIYTPDAFMFRQIHNYPMLVSNCANVTSTDTIHRVRVIDRKINIRKLSSICFNSLFFAQAEVMGRSYGGGVLELEPREAEKILVPYNSKIKVDYRKVDSLLRKNQIEDALNYVDQKVLREYLGLSSEFVNNIRSTWHELKERRHYRR